MKKISAIIIAMALVLGLSQCKKQETPTTSDADDGKVYITVNVNDGAKHEVYPSTGACVFTNGDILYVGNGGHFVGTLEYQSGAFSGSITSPSTSDYLHFYFTGGKTPATNPTTSTTSFTVNISDQSSKLPVLSYGRSTQLYTDANATYSTTLRNKCGLVKFVPSEATSNAITVSGMKTTATIDFATPGITPTDATGTVTLYSVSGSEKWAILLPQASVENPTVSNSDYQYSILESVPAVTANMYYNTGVSIVFSTKPFGAITINADGDMVFFSQGNLQYKASTDTWRFAENQWDYVGSQSPSNGNPGGTVVGSDNANISSNYDGWIDLFGWGTSGHHDDTHDPWNYTTNYYPWSTSTSTNGPSSNPTRYGPNTAAYHDISPNLTGESAIYDWGVSNQISNGGTYQWRTPTREEWIYVLRDRSTTSGIRYAKANVNGVNGVILLPDDWSSGTYSLNDTNNDNASFNSNTISASQWTVLENAHAVFLPTTGYRNGTSIKNLDQGNYWSASYDDGYMCLYNARFFGFSESQFMLETYSKYRYSGCSVRLVRDVQ